MPGLWSQASHECMLIAQLPNSHLGAAGLHPLPPGVGGVLVPLPEGPVGSVLCLSLLLLHAAGLPLLEDDLLSCYPLGGGGLLAHLLGLGPTLLSAPLSQNY